MASEIRVSSTLRYAKDTTSATLSTAFTVDQVGAAFEGGLQTIGITEEVLVKNDVGTIGYIGVKNTDTTNFVQIGATTGVYSVKLKPGEGTVTPWEATNVYMLANVAPCKVEYLLIEV